MMNRIAFKLILTGLALVFASGSANAQCSGQPNAGLVCGNPSSATQLPIWSTQTLLLDRSFGNTQGAVLNRGSLSWSATAGPVLGVNGGAGGSLTLNGASSGSTLIQVPSAAGTGTLFQLPGNNGITGQILITDGGGHTNWGSAGAGTVTSVGLSMPGIFTVTGSPVINTGTLTATLNNESANSVWAGPTTGAAAAPTFRALVGADLPLPTTSSLGGVQAINAVTSNWINSISGSGVPTLSQPAFSDISGSITPAQCPNPSASTIGCIESYAAVPSQWINTISTSGVPSSRQPNFSDLSGSATLAQLPSISNLSILANNSGGTSVPAALSTSQVLDMIGATQGDILYRDSGAWLVLGPGTMGQVLSSGGAAANPSWTTVSGTGTVTSVATNNGVTGGTITSSGTIGLATITSHTVLANITGGAAIPIANTPSSILDIIGSTTGNVLYRAGGGWTVLAPGTNGQVLTQGASTPSWSNVGTLTNVTIAGAGLTATSGTCNISTTGTCTLTTTAAAKSDQQAATSNILAVTPLHQQDHPSAAKAWVKFTGSSAAIGASYNISGVVRNSAGNYTVSFTTPFATTNYVVNVTSGGNNNVISVIPGGTLSTGSFSILTENSSFVAADPISVFITAFGAQ